MKLCKYEDLKHWDYLEDPAPKFQVCYQRIARSPQPIRSLSIDVLSFPLRSNLLEDCSDRDILEGLNHMLACHLAIQKNIVEWYVVGGFYEEMDPEMQEYAEYFGMFGLEDEAC